MHGCGRYRKIGAFAERISGDIALICDATVLRDLCGVVFEEKV